MIDHGIFNDREEAGWMLVERLRGTTMETPLVLAIPRGGVEIGAVLARGLGAELDVVLARKLRAPHQPELALGAVSESGEVGGVLRGRPILSALRTGAGRAGGGTASRARPAGDEVGNGRCSVVTGEAHPLITPSGLRRATFSDSPARWTTSTTMSTSL